MVCMVPALQRERAYIKQRKSPEASRLSKTIAIAITYCQVGYF